MANNCLVTKLNGVVDNDNLPKLGSILLNVSQETIVSANQQIFVVRPVYGSSVKVSIIGDGYLALSMEDLPTSTLKTVTINFTEGGTMICFTNGNYKITIENKYLVSQLKLFGTDTARSIIKTDLSEISHIPQLNYIDGKGVTGDISLLKTYPYLGVVSLRKSGTVSVHGDIEFINPLDRVTIFQFNGKNIFGNISNFSTKSTLINVDLGGTSVDGDIVNFAGCINLTYLALYNTYVSGNVQSLGLLTNINEIHLEYCSNVNGSVESLAQEQANNGRRSGTIKFSAYGSSVTYQGLALGGGLNITFNNIPPYYTITTSV